MIEYDNTIVFLGLSITSSWGNGHATTYRSLIRALADKGQRVVFLEHDKPWYASNRDMPNPSFCETHLYSSFEDCIERFGELVRNAPFVVVGSYVPEGIKIGNWVASESRGVTAFYDIDTPVTMAMLSAGTCEYLSESQISAYDLYLSFSGGHVLSILERDYGSPRALPLHCSVDALQYYPFPAKNRWTAGYMGTYSPDRAPGVENMILRPAELMPDKRFVVAGPQFPDTDSWAANVEHIEHLPPSGHCTFYNKQLFTVNVTRSDMVRAGWSPSVRLFEAAACGTPIISDWWEGLDSFFEPESEILIGSSPESVVEFLHSIPDHERRSIGERARRRVLAEHTSERRAEQLIQYAQLAGVKESASANST